MVRLWRVHQIVGVVNDDFSDGGAAGIRQVRVGMVDGESAETCGESHRGLRTWLLL